MGTEKSQLKRSSSLKKPKNRRENENSQLKRSSSLKKSKTPAENDTPSLKRKSSMKKSKGPENIDFVQDNEIIDKSNAFENTGIFMPRNTLGGVRHKSFDNKKNVTLDIDFGKKI